MDRVEVFQMLEELQLRSGSDRRQQLPPDKYEVIIVGAGIAGPALAHALGTAGRKVLILERDWSEPHRIVGELLQPGGIARLKQLGIESALEGIDSPNIYGYAVFKDPPAGERIKLTYPDLDSKGNPIGRSFHHGRFVMGLRRCAKSAPNVTCVQGTVTGLIESDGAVRGVTYSFKGEGDARQQKEARGHLTVICDGCNSSLRKNFVELKPESEISLQAASSFYGVILKTQNVNLPFPNHGHVILASPAPILMYPISTSEVRMLIDIPNPAPARDQLPHFLRTITAPQVPEELRAAFLAAIEENNIMSMPNSKLHPDPFIRLGALCIGDSFNMRHPLTGGGMTVALNDVVIVRDLLAQVPDLSNCALVASQWKHFYWRRYPLASTINILSLALYAVFAANDDKFMPFMREGCFAYFRLGGRCVSGPMSMLGALRPSPMLLVTHFFAVAIYGSLLILKGKKGIPTFGNLYTAIQVIISAAKVILPLMYAEMVFRFKHPVPRGTDKVLQQKQREEHRS